MAYTYSTFKTALAAEIEVDEDDADYVAILPTFIDYAEGRIYRELDLLTAYVTTDGTLTANSRSFTLPVTNGHVLAVDYINILDDDDVRHSAVPVQRAVIDMCWPSDVAAAASSIPDSFARISDAVVLFGPPPGAAWSCEVVHTIRPTALSNSNTTTFLTTYLADLFFAAAMISVSGWTKNYGAQSSDPKEAQSWESQYQTLKQSAMLEELRKKFVVMMSG